MLEFGSDYHRCDAPFHGSMTLDAFFPSRQLYACGRMALIELIRHNDWKRLWLPAYFCHEIAEIWRQHISVCFYDDFPLEEHEETTIQALPFREGDALLRMNYFGLRTKRSNTHIPVPVIEDHSNALTSDWALHSDADWCIASLRKTLPLAFGGMLWSPKEHDLPEAPQANNLCNGLANDRYRAMTMKADYLMRGGNKEAFRTIYIDTEEGLNHLTGTTAIDPESYKILHQLDIQKWNDQRCRNWTAACNHLKHIRIIGSGQKQPSPFSIIILLPSQEERDILKSYLLQHNIFPATLWNIPKDIPFGRCIDFGTRMLSLHCDARYTEQDIQTMCEIINRYDSNY